MTSNLGSDAQTHKSILGFNESDAVDTARNDKMLSALKTAFNPEFLNRIDEIICFKKPSRDDISVIAERRLYDVCERAKNINIKLNFDKSVTELIVDKVIKEDRGARPVARACIRFVEDELTDLILSQKIKSGDTAFAKVIDGKVIFEISE